MTRRRQFRETEVIATVLMQGATIPCKRCGEPITIEDVKSGNVEKEHLHELELGGADEPTNCAFSHKARPCHAQVTHGSPATFAGSSRHRIAKATDPARIEKFKVDKRPLDDTSEAIPGRCRGCGEYPSECTCAPRVKRQAFSGRR